MNKNNFSLRFNCFKLCYDSIKLKQMIFDEVFPLLELKIPQIKFNIVIILWKKKSQKILDDTFN
jgi:hypothetical protein